MSSNLVITHKGCADGFAASYAAKKALGGQAFYIQCSYGDVPQIPDTIKKIWIFDFSFPRDILIEWSKNHKIELWDHHKTAYDELKDLEFCHFDMDKSGAVLAWERFFPRENIPSLFLYIQDRDLWKHQLEETHEINSYIFSQDMTFESYDKMVYYIEKDFNTCSLIGSGALKARNIQVKNLTSGPRVMFKTIGGYTVPVVNSANYQSDIAHELCKKYNSSKFAAVYFDRADGERVWSLRSNSDFDVSKVAKKYGGGGHPQAASFYASIKEIF